MAMRQLTRRLIRYGSPTDVERFEGRRAPHAEELDLRLAPMLWLHWLPPPAEELDRISRDVGEPSKVQVTEVDCVASQCEDCAVAQPRAASQPEHLKLVNQRDETQRLRPAPMLCSHTD